jgi:hypothetical protein
MLRNNYRRMGESGIWKDPPRSNHIDEADWALNENRGSTGIMGTVIRDFLARG